MRQPDLLYGSETAMESPTDGNAAMWSRDDWKDKVVEISIGCLHQPDSSVSHLLPPLQIGRRTLALSWSVLQLATVLRLQFDPSCRHLNLLLISLSLFLCAYSRVSTWVCVSPFLPKRSQRKGEATLRRDTMQGVKSSKDESRCVSLTVIMLQSVRKYLTSLEGLEGA